MKITKNKIRKLIVESINNVLLEGFQDNQLAMANSIVDSENLTNDFHKENILALSQKPYNFDKKTLTWLANWYNSNEGKSDNEPAEDVGQAIASFKKVSKKIPEFGLSPDIKNFKSPGELRRAYAKTQGRVVAEDLEKESTLIGEYGPWEVRMPHSREASCEIGSGTTWCTAISGRGNNLFYNYIAGGQQYGVPVILYYVRYINKESMFGSKLPDEAFKKISIGYQGDKIFWPEEQENPAAGDGMITVNANNSSVTKQKFQSVINNIYPGAAQEIINDITNHGNSLQGVHPANDNLQRIANDLNAYKREIKGKSPDMAADTIELLVYQKEFKSDFTIADDVMSQISADAFNIMLKLVKRKTKQWFASAPDPGEWGQYGDKTFSNFIYDILEYGANEYGGNKKSIFQIAEDSQVKVEDVEKDLHRFYPNPYGKKFKLADNRQKRKDLYRMRNEINQKGEYKKTRKGKTELMDIKSKLKYVDLRYKEYEAEYNLSHFNKIGKHIIDVIESEGIEIILNPDSSLAREGETSYGDGSEWINSDEYLVIWNEAEQF